MYCGYSITTYISYWLFCSINFKCLQKSFSLCIIKSNDLARRLFLALRDRTWSSPEGLSFLTRIRTDDRTALGKRHYSVLSGRWLIFRSHKSAFDSRHASLCICLRDNSYWNVFPYPFYPKSLLFKIKKTKILGSGRNNTHALK